MNKILVLSYNEGNKEFNDKDNFIDINKKINKEKPELIVLCSQESRYYGNNFGSNLYYNYLHKNYDYIKHDRISKKILEKSIKSLPNIIIKYGDVRTKIFIKKNNQILNTFTSIDFTLGKGSIMSKIDFNGNKFIFVNSHYAFKGSGNTGLEKRTEQFFKTINEFKLYKYVDTHQIFFCGDLNFRLDEKFFNIHKNKFNKYLNKYKIPKTRIITPSSTLNNNENFINSKNNSKTNIIFEKFEKLHYLINKLENKESYQFNELYQILSSKELQDILKTFEYNEKIIQLYENFKKSIEETGIYITCRYREGMKNIPINFKKISKPINSKKTNKEIISYKDKGLVKLKRLSEKKKDIINSFNEEVQICDSIISCEKKGTPRIPSMCDKILYSLTEKISLQFLQFFVPYLSDHKMIGIIFEINNKKINNKKIGEMETNFNYKNIYNNKKINQNLVKLNPFSTSYKFK